MEKVLLTDICKIQYGYAFDSNLFSDTTGLPLVRIRDVVRGYSETFTTENCPDDYTVNDGDILVGMDGEFNVALWHGGKAVLNQRVCKIIPNNSICKDYIYYFMPIALKLIEDRTPFVTVKHLSAKELNKIQVPLVEREQQEFVANSLKIVDLLIVKRKQQLKKMDELVKFRFVEVFGESRTNPKDWITIALKELADIGSSKRVFVEELQESGIPFYRGTEVGALAEGQQIIPELYITEDHYRTLVAATGAPTKGDLLMPSICSGGRIWLVDTDKPFYFKDGRVLWVHPNSNEINSRYLQHVLKERIMSDYGSIASGSTFAELKIFALKALHIMLPPLELQNQFAAFVEQADKSKVEIQKGLEKLDLLKKSLMLKYFGGNVW